MAFTPGASTVNAWLGPSCASHADTFFPPMFFMSERMGVASSLLGVLEAFTSSL